MGSPNVQNMNFTSNTVQDPVAGRLLGSDDKCVRIKMNTVNTRTSLRHLWSPSSGRTSASSAEKDGPMPPSPPHLRARQVKQSLHLAARSPESQHASF